MQNYELHLRCFRFPCQKELESVGKQNNNIIFTIWTTSGYEQVCTMIGLQTIILYPVSRGAMQNRF